MKSRMIRDRAAYSMTFWAIFIGLVMIPLMALSIEVGRFLFARTQIAAAADAAALAAAVEINERLYVNTGILAPTSKTYQWAQRAVNANCEELIELDVYPGVGGILVVGNTVRVSVSADLGLMFPSIVPDIKVTEWGTAEVRALHD